MATPKGMFARSRRDFGIDAVGCGHVDNLAHLANPTVSLYNNAPIGTKLGITGFSFSKDAAAGTLWMRLQYGTVGAFVSNGLALRLGGPVPYGQFYSLSDAAASGFNKALFFGGFGNIQAGQIIRDSPFVILQPGWSMAVFVDGTAGVCSNWWWTQE